MAINKNFVVKNGFEVATNLVYADSDLYNVGIGSTIPRTLLDVRGGIAVTDFSSSGISTFLGEVNIGLGGQYVTFLNSKSGFGTDNPHYLVHINSPVSTGQTALYVRGDMVVTGDINLDDLTLDTLNSNDVTTGTLTGTIATITTLDGDLADFVNISANTGIVTTIRGTNLSYSGIGTITNIDNVNLDVSGIATIATLNASSVTVTGVNVATGSIGNLYSTNSYINVGIVTTLRGNNLSYSGIGTIATLDGTTADFNTIYANVGIVTILRGTNLSYSGIGTIATLDGTTADFTNLYATTGIVTTISGTTATYTNSNSTNLNTTNLKSTNSYLTNSYINVGIVTTLRGNNLNYSGISTISSLSGNLVNYTNAYFDNAYSDVGIVTTITGNNLNYSGIGTIINFNSDYVTTTTLVSDIIFSASIGCTDFQASGVSILGNVRITDGSISANSGIITYYGDGSRLSNVIGGVGLATTGGVVGYGATILEFRGPGISTITIGSGIGTIDVTGGGAGATTIEKNTYTVTSSTQSVFTLSSGYQTGYIDVYLNGVRLSSADYTESASNQITLNSAAVNGDVVDIINYKEVSIGISSVSFATTSFGLEGIPDIRVGDVTSESLFSLNSNLVNIVSSGIVTVSSLVVSGGTSNDFLKGDGSLDSNAYASTGKAIAMSMIFG